ncbi:MAG: hypothetical protein OEV21_07725 [Thermoplasmata archaeon]|nr:hypothetical protein [Thermoplasmata archaeon]
MEKKTQRYLMIELACDETQCNPCTYPNCQRYVRHLPKSKKLTATIKPIASKTLEVKLEKEAEPQYPHHINRYILAELSCTNAKCSPCTYPNCQRFTRSKKVSGKVKGPSVSVTELKGDKQVKQIIDVRK